MRLFFIASNATKRMRRPVRCPLVANLNENAHSWRCCWKDLVIPSWKAMGLCAREVGSLDCRLRAGGDAYVDHDINVSNAKEALEQLKRKSRSS
jgi:hypothetical protein